VNNHAQTVSELQERLQVELDKNKQLEDDLKNLTRKYRDKQEKWKAEKKVAEDGLTAKEKEVAQLQNLVEQVSSESSRQLGALEKVVKTRGDFYRTKFQKQEDLFKQQNDMFKELQRQVSSMLEKRVIDIRTNKKDGPTLKAEDTGLPDAERSFKFGTVASVDIVPDDEFVLLQKLQGLVSEQAEQLISFDGKLNSFEKTNPEKVLIDHLKAWKTEVELQRKFISTEFGKYSAVTRNDPFLRDNIEKAVNSLKSELNMPLEQFFKKLSALQLNWEKSNVTPNLSPQ
jgi:hypothetical protein